MANDLRWIGRHVPRFVLFLCPLRRAMANDERDAAYDLIIVGNPFLCPLRRAMANDSGYKNKCTPRPFGFYALYVGLWLTTDPGYVDTWSCGDGSAARAPAQRRWSAARRNVCCPRHRAFDLYRLCCEHHRRAGPVATCLYGHLVRPNRGRLADDPVVRTLLHHPRADDVALAEGLTRRGVEARTWSIERVDPVPEASAQLCQFPVSTHLALENGQLHARPVSGQQRGHILAARVIGDVVASQDDQWVRNGAYVGRCARGSCWRPESRRRGWGPGRRWRPAPEPVPARSSSARCGNPSTGRTPACPAAG